MEPCWYFMHATYPGTKCKTADFEKLHELSLSALFTAPLNPNLTCHYSNTMSKFTTYLPRVGFQSLGNFTIPGGRSLEKFKLIIYQFKS